MLRTMDPQVLPLLRGVSSSATSGGGADGPNHDKWKKNQKEEGEKKKNEAWSTSIDGEQGPVSQGPPHSPSIINLGLGIRDAPSGGGGGGSSSSGHVITTNSEQQSKSVAAAAVAAFTPAQFSELHHQSLVFNHLAAGLPVPLPLVLPIWKSLPSSLGPASSAVTGYSPQEFDYGYMMDPEPGRCRRTDGKKWRCSYSVVPDQKYCERHMHRGRQRSRKHVEASEIPRETKAATASISSSKTNPTTDFMTTVNTNADLSMSIPVNLQLMTPSNNTSNRTPTAAVTTTTTSTISINQTKYNANDNKGSIAVKPPITTQTFNNELKTNVEVERDRISMGTGIGGDADNNSGGRSNCRKIGIKDNFSNQFDGIHNPNRSGIKVGAIASHGFGFSPRSVLYGDGVISCNSPCIEYRNLTEPDLQRCRRTDGKKWRCNKDVVPEQKYCGRHMHRGAKRLVAASQQVTVAASGPSTCTTHFSPPLAIPKKADDLVDLNTNLSISVTSPRPTTDVEKSATSGSTSSDATTISEEISSVSHRLALSP